MSLGESVQDWTVFRGYILILAQVQHFYITYA